MARNEKRRQNTKKTVIRVVCIVLAASMVAGIVCSVLYYLFQ